MQRATYVGGEAKVWELALDKKNKVLQRRKKKDQMGSLPPGKAAKNRYPTPSPNLKAPKLIPRCG